MARGYAGQKNPAQQRPARVEYSAGGIVFRLTPHGPEIAFIEDPWHKWTFAKGHIKRGENIMKAAVRETAEEMGLSSLRPVRMLGRIEIWFIDRYVYKGALIHKYIYYALMEAPQYAKTHPQRRELMGTVHWVPLGKALKASSYKDVRPVLEKAIQSLSSPPKGRGLR